MAAEDELFHVLLRYTREEWDAYEKRHEDIERKQHALLGLVRIRDPASWRLDLQTIFDQGHKKRRDAHSSDHKDRLNIEITAKNARDYLEKTLAVVVPQFKPEFIEGLLNRADDPALTQSESEALEEAKAWLAGFESR